MNQTNQLKCQLRFTRRMINTGLTSSSYLHSPVSSDRANRESGDVGCCLSDLTVELYPLVGYGSTVTHQASPNAASPHFGNPQDVG